MDGLPNDIDREVTDGLSNAELSEMLIDYAQENERLETENKQLRAEVETLRSCRAFMREAQAKENKRLQAKCELLSQKYLELLGLPPRRSIVGLRDDGRLVLHVITPVRHDD